MGVIMATMLPVMESVWDVMGATLVRIADYSSESESCGDVALLVRRCAAIR